MSSVSGVIDTALSTGYASELWIIAPAALVITAVLWGVPKGISFFKRVAK